LRTGDRAKARRAYEFAIGLQSDPAARAFLVERMAALDEATPAQPPG